MNQIRTHRFKLCWQKLISLSTEYTSIKLWVFEHVCTHTCRSGSLMFRKPACVSWKCCSLTGVTDQLRYSLTASEFFGSVPTLWCVTVTGWTWWALSGTLLYNKAPCLLRWLENTTTNEHKLSSCCCWNNDETREVVCLWCCFCQHADTMQW